MGALFIALGDTHPERYLSTLRRSIRLVPLTLCPALGIRWRESRDRQEAAHHEDDQNRPIQKPLARFHRCLNNAITVFLHGRLLLKPILEASLGFPNLQGGLALTARIAG